MAKSKPLTGKAAPVERPRRRNRHHEVTEAAVEVFWRKGYPAASIQDVADHVGVLKGSLYHYIDSKEDLLSEILDRVHERSTQILDEVLELDLTALERLWIYIEGHARWYLADPKEVTVFLREWRHLSGERLEVARERRRRYDRTLRDLIGDARKEGDVSAEITVKYASLYVLAAMNAMPEWYHPDRGDLPGPIAEAYADMTVSLLTGTSRRPAEDRRAARSHRAA